MAVFTPISRPALSSSGPPELPGLIAASVWMTSRIVRPVTAGMVRPRALTMPVVRLWSRPKGLPMAKTFWPTCRSLLLPTGMGRRRLAGAVSWRTAMSLSGAAPTTSAFQLE